MAFDFQSFLSKTDPSQAYEFHSLLGGLVNLTSRARKTSSSGGGIFPKHGTLILKYAPPFVAALGEDAPFSQDRQLVEARALAQFTAPKGPLSSLGHSSLISVPELLYHSVDDHVLIFEDLGPLATLPEYLTGFSDDNANTNPETCRRIGARVGEFFAKLHSPESLQQVRSATSDDLENHLIKDLVLQAAVMPLKDYLARYEIPNAQDLFSRVLADYQRVTSPAELCFVLGDFTPGAVLTAASGDGEQPVGIIDWEFSGVGRGPNGDMAQCLASLHLSLMAALPGSRSYGAIKSLIQGVCSSYYQHSREWLEKGTASVAEEPNAHALVEANLHLQIFRSALILHGREMINNAIEREWPGSPQKESTILVKEMVQKGAWYIERARDDVRGMMEAANWDELLMEDDQIMLSLFGIETQLSSRRFELLRGSIVRLHLPAGRNEASGRSCFSKGRTNTRKKPGPANTSC